MFLLALSIITFIFSYITWNLYTNLLIYIISNTAIRCFIAFIFMIFEFLSLFLCIKNGVGRLLKYVSYMFLFIVVFMLISFVLEDILILAKIKINRFYITLFVLVFAIFLAIYGYINRAFIRITNYNINTGKNIKLKIVFLSDIHIGAIGTSKKILNRIVKKINEVKPDIVIFGGDIIETKINEEIIEDCKIFRGIKTKFGVYGVIGNHEYYTKEIENIIKILKDEAHIDILTDDFRKIDENIILVGRHDIAYYYMYGEKRKKLNEILDDNNNYLYKIAVDHNPKYFNEAVENNFDLQLSGHTHNGQFFPFNIIVRLSYEKAYGLLKKMNSNLIVSSGAGTWGPPIKVMSKPEIVLVNLE